MRRIPSLLLTACALLLGSSGAVRAQTGENVLVVANGASELSVRLAEHYARGRGVPESQVLKLDGLSAAPPDEIPRAEYFQRIQAPIARWLGANDAYDRILYIVLVKGIPLRIAGTGGRAGSVSSVDSELALLYHRLVGESPGFPGGIDNPYFLGDAPISDARPFSHEHFDIYLVTRLDGYTEQDVLALIAKGRTPATNGRFVLDMRASLNPAGNAWLLEAAKRLEALGWGDRVLLEQTSRVITGEQNLLGYYSWGSNDPAITQRSFGLGFVPGAIAGMFVSTDGRTFREPPADWKIGPWGNPRTYFEGAPQSLAGDLIREGVTGIAGHVAEPYLDATIRPDILFPAYVSGFNLAEAYYLAMPKLGWQTVVIGDPLCAPFRQQQLTREQLDPPINAETEMPEFYHRRRLQALLRTKLDERALKWSMRADARAAKGDEAGRIAALEEATRLEPRLSASHLQLAQMFENQGQYDKAVERYEAVLANDEANFVALNNLAFVLAEHMGKPEEALPYAQRAYLMTREQAQIGDTLAWIYHLLGDDRTALPLLEAAAKRVPKSAEIRLHLAVVQAALGDYAAAEASAVTALKLDASLAGNRHYIALQERLKGEPAENRLKKATSAAESKP